MKLAGISCYNSGSGCTDWRTLCFRRCCHRNNETRRFV